MSDSRSVSVEYSKKFLRSINQLPKTLQERASEREQLFKKNAFDPRLNTHKLHGKDKDLWAYSIDHKYRIKFLFDEIY
jgi:mRNA-degrading endonuclease RelE of RelBE toxin-antitoxin system